MTRASSDVTFGIPSRVSTIPLAGLLALVSPSVGPPDAWGQAASTCETIVPCGDRSGCPDLVADMTYTNPVISQETWTFDQCAVIEGEVESGDRRLLRFTSATTNLGPGDVIIGSPADYPDLFDSPTCHGHPHLKGYATYRLWTVRGFQEWLALRQNNPGLCSTNLLDANPRVARQVVAGRKQGFCLLDVGPSTLAPCLGSHTPPKYKSCVDDMGLSACWIDAYQSTLDGQWIDVTGLRRGEYLLEIEANPSRVIRETDYLNNSATIPVTLP